jgi:hypothetical protein
MNRPFAETAGRNIERQQALFASFSAELTDTRRVTGAEGSGVTPCAAGADQASTATGTAAQRTSRDLVTEASSSRAVGSVRRCGHVWAKESARAGASANRATFLHHVLTSAAMPLLHLCLARVDVRLGGGVSRHRAGQWADNASRVRVWPPPSSLGQLPGDGTYSCPSKTSSARRSTVGRRARGLGGITSAFSQAP